MPFRSTAQQRYMFARHPEIAHRWADEMKGAHRKGARKHPISSANLPRHVGKGVLSGVLRRAPKEAAPTIRMGVTRAGRVGVEFEHQGVKGWGVNHEAARASWQQNRAMAKRDSWEVPMDHFEPARPRRRTNYASGNTVGKKMATGASTGVVKPKQLQPTRTAPRKAAAALPIGQPPIPPNMVGKSRRDAVVIGGGIATGTVAGLAARVHRHRLVRRENALQNLSQGQLQQMYAKRDRSFNPEANRQRRLGIITAGAGIGGAASIGSGGRDIRRDTRAVRGIDPDVVKVPAEPKKPRMQAREGGTFRSLTDEEKDKAIRGHERALGHHARMKQTREGLESAARAGEHGMVVSRRSAGKLGLGAGLLAGAGAMAQHGRSRANREWR